MLLGDGAIRERQKSRPIITNMEEDQILYNPASVNLRIGNTFLIPKHNVKDAVVLGDKLEYKRVEVKEDKLFYLKPGMFVLATTEEEIKIPNDASAFVQGRSSIGRVGLSVQNAGFVDPGFHGHITLELKNESENLLGICPGYPVAQLIIIQTIGVKYPYSGKYNGQVEATGSRMEMDEFAIKRAKEAGK